MKTIRVVMALVFGLMGAQETKAQPYPAARVVGQGANGYTVQIGSQTFVALNDSVVQRIAELKTTNEALARENAKLQEMVAAYARTDTAMQRLRAVSKEYVGELEAAVAGWRALAEDYKKLRSPGTLSLQGALGFSGGDTKPGMLVGLGIGKLRVYGLVQENNLGGFAGIDLPIF